MKRRALQDQYFRRAKREGYLARSAYKLLEIQEKKCLIRPGDRVLDLGCAPGSWLQVAAELVGPRGAVVGVDLTPVRHGFASTVTAIEADAFTLDPAALPGGPFDVLLSDLAPATAGDLSDHYRSMDLCHRALDLAGDVLRPGGGLAMKALEGEAYRELLDRAVGLFYGCKGYRPRATRDASTEIYIIGRGFRPGGGEPVRRGQR